MPETRLILGASASLPDLRPCRLLRQLAESSCHETLHPHDASGDGLLRARRTMGLVLRRSDATGRAGARRAVLAVRSALLLEELTPWPIWTCTKSRSLCSTTSMWPRWANLARGGYCATGSICSRPEIVSTNSSSSSEA